MSLPPNEETSAKKVSMNLLEEQNNTVLLETLLTDSDFVRYFTLIKLKQNNMFEDFRELQDKQKIEILIRIFFQVIFCKISVSWINWL